MANREKTTEQKEIIKNIKERLKNIVESRYQGLTGKSAIDYADFTTKTLNDNFIYTPSSTKVQDLLDPISDRGIDIIALMEICTFFGIPLSDVLKSDEIIKENFHNIKSSYYLKTIGDRKEKVISPFHDNWYDGEYYCYSFNLRNDPLSINNERIVEWRMRISTDLVDDYTQVSLTEAVGRKRFDGGDVIPYTSTGRLVKFDHLNMCEANLISDDGKRVINLMFEYIPLSNDIKYFIPASIQTCSYNERHKPLTQKMICFRVKMDLSNRKNELVIRGILKNNAGKIIITRESMCEIIGVYGAEYEDMIRELLSYKEEKEVYFYTEEDLRNRLRYLDIEGFPKMEFLQIVKGFNEAAAQQIVKEDEPFASFIKRFQLDQANEDA